MTGQFGCHIRIQQCQNYKNHPQFNSVMSKDDLRQFLPITLFAACVCIHGKHIESAHVCNQTVTLIKVASHSSICNRYAELSTYFPLNAEGNCPTVIPAWPIVWPSQSGPHQDFGLQRRFGLHRYSGGVTTVNSGRPDVYVLRSAIPDRR